MRTLLAQQRLARLLAHHLEGFVWISVRQAFGEQGAQGRRSWRHGDGEVGSQIGCWEKSSLSRLILKLCFLGLSKIHCELAV